MIDADIQREYTAATEGAGLIQLSDWTTVRIAGRDRASFLHNMCTNEVKLLTAGSGCEAFFTDVKGKVLAHAFILVSDNVVQLITVPGQAERLIAHLDRYIIREDVQLADASQEVSWLLVTGRHAGFALGQFDPVTVASLSALWSHASTKVDSAGVQIARCDVPWCGGYLVGMATNECDAVFAALQRVGATPCFEPNWHAIRVESNWPLWGVDFDDSNLPQEVNRDALAIHFRKGCYLGQETVARIDALGHVNKKLVQVRFNGDNVPAIGADVTAAGQSVGRITSAVWSPRWQAPAALAMLRRGANEPGQAVECDGQPGEVVPASGG
ncbi:MAG TPA: glycine cleavage T C-terminal barrel domain-containing protein [Lacipirellula sp.]